MAIATLAGGVVTVRDIEKIWESIGGERTLLKPLFKALTPLYPGRQGLEGWRPDVLGEALIAQVLLSDNGSVLLSAVLRQNDRKIRQSSLTVLGRMLRNRSEIAQIVEDVLVENFVSCADDIVAASLETPSTLPIIAEHAFSRLRSSDQCKAADLLARHVNFDIPHLSRLDVVVSRVLAERVKRSLKKQTIESKVKYGTALLNLAIALQRDGKIEEASQVALDALGIRKRLAEINPERFESNLATALSVYSGVLGEQGKNELAVAYVLQSLEIRRRLAKAGTPKLEAELAVSLTNYSTFLDRLGRVEESAHVGEEALETCEKLAESNPELYGDDLAIALLNHAVSLSNRGQTDEAVESAKRAVAIHEKLAHAKPERFEYSHARSLRGCASFLEDQGKIEEAIASCTQALAIFEKLAAAKPERFQGDLARTMSSYSSYLAENGQTEAAINAAKRALDIRTTLAEVKPERFEAELATSLINYSNLLAKRGYVEQALEISQRGLDIRQKMSEEYPMQHEPGIGVALGNRASYFANVGRWEDAVHQEERALEIFRRCAERTPALYAFHQEVSRTALSFWKWLWDRSPVRPLEEGIMTVSANWRDSLVLQYQLRCFNALATPDASLVESALAAWAKLNCVQQHNWRESYFALAVIAEAVLGDGNAPPHWREAFNQYLQRNNGWMPFWIGEVAERSGIDMGIR
jgi:tetratricopeptide (TPR) repeat protein